MALTFTDGSTDYINLGNGGGLDDLGTWTQIFWYKMASTTNFRRFATKTNDSTSLRSIFMIGSDYTIRVNRVTTQTNFQGGTIPTGVWSFDVITFDLDASPSVNLWQGNLTTLAVDANTSGFGIKVDGAGAIVSEVGQPLLVGNFRVGNSNAPDWDLAHYSIYNRVLSEGEIWAQQFRPHVINGCVSFLTPGWVAAASTIPDWSGNGNDGTPLNLTLAPHVPLGPAFGYDNYATSGTPTPPVGGLSIPVAMHHYTKNILAGSR